MIVQCSTCINLPLECMSGGRGLSRSATLFVGGVLEVALYFVPFSSSRLNILQKSVLLYISLMEHVNENIHGVILCIR